MSALSIKTKPTASPPFRPPPSSPVTGWRYHLALPALDLGPLHSARHLFIQMPPLPTDVARTKSGFSHCCTEGLGMTVEEVASRAPAAALDAMNEERASRSASRSLGLLCCVLLADMILRSPARLSSTGWVVSASTKRNPYVSELSEVKCPAVPNVLGVTGAAVNPLALEFSHHRRHLHDLLLEVELLDVHKPG